MPAETSDQDGIRTVRFRGREEFRNVVGIVLAVAVQGGDPRAMRGFDAGD
jgi:hypothetical protein